MSEGQPTKLVRDGHATSHDEPPEGAFVRAPDLIDPDPTSGPSDLRRADDAERAGSAVDQGKIYMRQMDAVWSDGAPDFTRIMQGEEY
jgi:hypothetical protein